MTYDKSISLEMGQYVPYVRDGEVRIALEPCNTLADAQKLLDTFPPDMGESIVCHSTAVAVNVDWFHAKLDREDEFENFLSRVDQCR